MWLRIPSKGHLVKPLMIGLPSHRSRQRGSQLSTTVRMKRPNMEMELSGLGTPVSERQVRALLGASPRSSFPIR